MSLKIEQWCPNLGSFAFFSLLANLLTDLLIGAMGVIAISSQWLFFGANAFAQSEIAERRTLLQEAKTARLAADYLKEIRILTELVNDTPKDYIVLTELGKAYISKTAKEDSVTAQKDLEKAADYFRTAIESNREYLPSQENLLKVLELLDDRFEARSLLTDMIQRFGERPAYLASLCRLYSLDSYIDKAIETCGKSVEKNPRDADSRVYIGLSLRDKEEDKQAEKILRQAAKQFPKSELAQWAAGQITYDRKNYVESFKLFTQGIKFDPTSVRCWIGRGLAAIETGQYKEVIESFDKACQYDRQSQTDLKKAAGVLRSKKLFDWSSKLESALVNCGSKQQKIKIKPLHSD